MQIFQYVILSHSLGVLVQFWADSGLNAFIRPISIFLNRFFPFISSCDRETFVQNRMQNLGFQFDSSSVLAVKKLWFHFLKLQPQTWASLGVPAEKTLHYQEELWLQNSVVFSNSSAVVLLLRTDLHYIIKAQVETIEHLGQRSELKPAIKGCSCCLQISPWCSDRPKHSRQHICRGSFALLLAFSISLLMTCWEDRWTHYKVLFLFLSSCCVTRGLLWGGILSFTSLFEPILISTYSLTGLLAANWSISQVLWSGEDFPSPPGGGAKRTGSHSFPRRN